MSDILIGGDFVVNTNLDWCMPEDIKSYFAQNHLNILNLESPITSPLGNNKITKTGPHLHGLEKETAKIVKELNINLLTTANNHVSDYGEKGITDTINFCKNEKINSIGSGINLEEAKKPFRNRIKDKQISILNFAENEWSSAKHNHFGANPLDIIENANQIKQEKKISDFVIVIAHVGHEYYNLPSPRIKKELRFFVDNGADLVVCHHTHTISGMETYKGADIYYGIGNFLFTNESGFESWYKGLVVEITIVENKLNTKTKTFKQSKSNFELSFELESERVTTKKELEKLNYTIKNEDDLIKRWDEYCLVSSKSVLNYWSPLNYLKNRYIRAIFKLCGMNFLNSSLIKLYLNLIRCESHRDLSIHILEKQIKEK